MGCGDPEDADESGDVVIRGPGASSSLCMLLRF